MKVFWRVLVIVAVFAGVGALTGFAVVAHASAGRDYQPEVRLAGAMAGLFAGGAAATVVGIGMVWRRK